jgi:hypothetical protein
MSWNAVRIEFLLCAIAATSCGGADAALNVNPDASDRFDAAAPSATRDGGGTGNDGSEGQPQGDDAGVPGYCAISTTHYDQSCSSNADCVNVAGSFPVQGGNYCQPMCLCGGAAINASAVDQYVADVMKTPLGSGAVPASACNCPDAGVPCCTGGRCSVSTCEPFNLAPEIFPDGSTLCSEHGPVDAGYDAGSALWCVPPTTCTSYNGGWACCQPSGPNGIFCIPPK